MSQSNVLTWFDAHLDLAYLAAAGRDLAAPHAPDGAAITFNALAAGHVRQMLATVFTQRRVLVGTPDQLADGPWCYSSVDEAHSCCEQQLAQYASWQKSGRIAIAAPGALPPPQQAEADSPPQVCLLLEGATGLRNEDDLRTFYAGGVRVLALTWVDGNQWSGGDQSGGDITPAGRRLLAQADQLNMVHDASHLSEQAFWTLLEIARGPKIASHSNCRSLLPGKQHPERHLSDQQIKALVAAGGVIGINLFGKFLTTDGRASIAHVTRHVAHITNLVGRDDCIGLGSDMDGGFTNADLPDGIRSPADLYKIADALADANYSDAFIHRFAHENWHRFFAAAMP